MLIKFVPCYFRAPKSIYIPCASLNKVVLGTLRIVSINKFNNPRKKFMSDGYDHFILFSPIK